ncbi:hypothetical protein HMN09_00316100 [Mycena chlorophos]|uniref:Uncharacterized protein n=1 Tax=Mycena chlorophos TaxID=658473 RepID=A0A8H6TJZ1_MYCCL|nr:hypothetical protein HMN09_00316100 [Mycena chlorophos]
MAPPIYFTSDKGRTLNLVSHIAYKGSQRDILYQRGQRLQEEYEELLDTLCSRMSPSNFRLQKAMVAAVYDLDRPALHALSEADFSEYQGKLACLLRDQAPPLVTYLGGPRPAPIAASQSLSTTLRYTSIADIQDADEYEGEGESFHERPWNPLWDEFPDPLPCSWGWHMRAYNVEATLIFISGAYVAWPSRWPESRGRELVKLLAHFQVVVFHELIHFLRTKVHGLEKQTPEKTIDHPSKVTRGVGESGRYAESLAFGGIIDMFLTPEDEVLLFTTNPAAPTGTADYQLNRQIFDSLFTHDTPPIDFAQLRTTGNLVSVPIPTYARSKSGGCGSVVEVVGEPPVVETQSESHGTQRNRHAIPPVLVEALARNRENITQGNRADCLWMRT